MGQDLANKRRGHWDRLIWTEEVKEHCDLGDACLPSDLELQRVARPLKLAMRCAAKESVGRVGGGFIQIEGFHLNLEMKQRHCTALNDWVCLAVGRTFSEVSKNSGNEKNPFTLLQ